MCLSICKNRWSLRTVVTVLLHQRHNRRLAWNDEVVEMEIQWSLKPTATATAVEATTIIRQLLTYRGAFAALICRWRPSQRNRRRGLARTRSSSNQKWLSRRRHATVTAAVARRVPAASVQRLLWHRHRRLRCMAGNTLQPKWRPPPKSKWRSMRRCTVPSNHRTTNTVGGGTANRWSHLFSANPIKYTQL